MQQKIAAATPRVVDAEKRPQVPNTVVPLLLLLLLPQ